MDEASKRCMCRKGFRLLDPDINKEQFRCIRNVGPGLNKAHSSESAIEHPSVSQSNFKVQALQGKENAYYLNFNINVAIINFINTYVLQKWP